MSSYDKVIKMACKPKPAPPKSKYMDNIIAATYSEDGAVHDVCKALAPKFKEPNAIVVFKALIVLHTMIRNGATDNVLAYLSSSEVLRLRNVSNGQWEGYTPPQNLSNYAHYLDARIRAYRDLKHDPIRVQAESNRDLRVGQMDEENRRSTAGPSSGGGGGSSVQRSKTIMGRKLRVMTVEKGLLRETKIVQKLIDTLLDCRFYLDDLKDELTTTALSLLVKDLLVLFQACNEGVINVLENYFEMSQVDATAALGLYRHFCKQTEKVVDYLGVARKLENILNVPIPNLKHAPVSLAGALEEYLKDPNFEQNRIEYKTNKEIAARNKKQGKGILRKSEPAKSTSTPSSSTPEPATSTATTEAKKSEAPKELIDFFGSIEQNQSSMFDPQTNSPTSQYFQQQAAFNPFLQRQTVFATGTNPFPVASPFINVQPTGFIGAQATGFPGLQQSPFQQPFQQPFQAIQSQPTGFPASQSGMLSPASAAGGGVPPFLRPQSAGAALQPQVTGVNPFRQSMLDTQATGMPMFGGGTGPVASPFGVASPGNPFGQQMNGQQASQPQVTSPTPQNATSPFGFLSQQAGPNPNASTSPFANLNGATNQAPAPSNVNTVTTPPFMRPQSTPITSGNSAKPLVAQQTGSRNPFGKPKSPPPPPVPPVPTLGQLASGQFGGGFGSGSNLNGLGGAQSQPATATASLFNTNPPTDQSKSPFAAFGGSFNNAATTTSSPSSGGSFMSSLASSFTFDKPSTTSTTTDPTSSSTTSSLFGASATSPLTAQTTSNTITSSGGFSAFSSQPTGTSNLTSTPSISSMSSIQPQPTGFGGSAIKPFKPSSSFGASLLEALPTIPQGATPPSATPANATPTSSTLSNITNGTSPPPSNPSTGTTMFQLGALNSQTGGLGGLGSGAGFSALQPQPTGANPFRASMFPGAMPAFTSGTNATSPFGAGMGSPSGLTTSISQPSGLGSGATTGFGPSLFAGKTSPFAATTTTPSFGANLFGTNAASTPSTGVPGAVPGQQQPQQPQQSQQTSFSLI